MKKRLFVASDIPTTLVEDFSKYQESLSINQASWTKEENYHLTVAFLGYVSEENIGSIEKEISQIAANTSFFELHFEGVILAPPGKDARMIWAKLDPSDLYSELVSKVYSNTKPYITEQTRTERIPHITLARFREGERISEENLVQPQLRQKSFFVENVSLFETRQNNEAQPSYLKISTFKLQGR